MKTVNHLICTLLFLLPISASAQNDLFGAGSKNDIQIDTTYIVYVGEFKEIQNFDTTNLPFELIRLMDHRCRHMYFFGKFETRCDALFAKQLIEQTGTLDSRLIVRPYIGIKNNPDINVYAQVCH